jgi:hypothetical protein
MKIIVNVKKINECKISKSKERKYEVKKLNVTTNEEENKCKSLEKKKS